MTVLKLDHRFYFSSLHD